MTLQIRPLQFVGGWIRIIGSTLALNFFAPKKGLDAI